HGYVIVDLTPERAQAEWWFVDPARAQPATFGAARSTPRAVPMHLTDVTAPTEDPPPPTATSTTTTERPAGGAEDDGSSFPAVPVAAAGVAAAAAAGLLALRR